MNRKGYTLIELIITIAVVLIGLTFVVGFVGNCAGCNTADVPANARAWATSMGMKPTGVQCVTRDTDGDGYVSCTIRSEDGKLQNIECAGGFLNINEGCRIPKLQLQPRP